jgi:hypothetical protein
MLSSALDARSRQGRHATSPPTARSARLWRVSSGDHPLRAVLDELEPKPPESADREDKHAYASTLSRKLALVVADSLREAFPTVLPTSENLGHESLTGSAEGKKRLDVKIWDELLGLVLLVSLKTYSFQDWNGKAKTAGRYTKNIQRNGKELKDEADVIHRRQPYSVIIAILFLPDSACMDGNPDSTSNVQGPSSFASIVRRLRVRTGRALDPDEKRFDRFDLTERLYVGLYRYDGEDRGAVRFFDVLDDPPRNGIPAASTTLTLDDLVDEIQVLVKKRNDSGIEWSTLTDEIERVDEGD